MYCETGTPKKPHGARNRESEFTVNERASFPSKRECTKDEKEAMPLEAEESFETKDEAKHADNRSYRHKWSESDRGEHIAADRISGQA